MSNHDTLKEIGHRLSPTQQRDAVHIAVCPVMATEHFLPGEHVGIKDGKAIKNRGGSVECVGIIDPFMQLCIVSGEYVFVFLYPGSITSLRHEWVHPKIDAPISTNAPATISHDEHKIKSREWIADHANDLGLSADVLMENAETWLSCGEHTVQDGSERWRDCFNPTEFWHHYEIVTGKVVESDQKQSFYCCSC